MKRMLLLLLCPTLMLGNLSAQKSELLKPHPKHQTQSHKKEKEKIARNVAIADSLWKAQKKTVETIVSNRISFHQTELQENRAATIDTCLLDEAITEGSEKRTYTYDEKGRREIENTYKWNTKFNSWELDSKKRYEYQYDSFNRYTKRSIYVSDSSTGWNETEISRVEISYKGGNTYYKYYELHYYEDSKTLGLSYENGYDIQGREILYKYYNWQKGTSFLSSWTEHQYDANGETILAISWYGNEFDQNGTKEETLVSGLTTENKQYNWIAGDWRLEIHHILTTDDQGRTLKETHITKGYTEENYSARTEKTYEYNAAGRVTSETSYHYDSADNLIEAEKEIYTYDASNRITQGLYMEYKNGKFVNTKKTEFTYWGTENTRDEEEEFEGPLLTYSFYKWENNQWELDEQLTYVRNANGMITGGTSTERDQIRIDGSYLQVTRHNKGIFNNQGQIVGTEINYVNESGEIVREKKETYTYDSSNRKTAYQSWVKENNSWILDEEENYAYDDQGRTTLDEYRSKEEELDDNWHGSKKITEYEGNIVKNTSYSINPVTGIFNTHPDQFNSSGKLPDGSQQSIDISYDENGTSLYGHREEWSTAGSKETHAVWELNQNEWVGIRKTVTDSIQKVVHLPENPENDYDGIGQPSDNVFRSSHEEYYIWSDGNWMIQHQATFEEKPNGDLVYQVQNENNTETIVFSFDSEGRLVRMSTNNENTTVYTYYSNGLLETRNENGILTTYHYSTHSYQPLDLEEVAKEDETSLRIDGRTVTSANENDTLRVYSTSGTLLETGTGSVSLPESGIYIVTTRTTTRKFAVQ